MTDAPLTANSIADYFGFKSHWISTRPGEKIHYLDEGSRDADAVIFVHGSAIGITAAANFYLNIRAAVDAGYRVIAPDLYGYGWTESAPDIVADIFNQSEQIVRIMDELKIEKAFLIGNSLGGRISVRVAMEYPARIRGCVIIGAGGAVWKPAPRFVASYTKQEAPKSADRDTVLKAMFRLVDNPAMVSDKLVEFRTRMASRPGEVERYRQSTASRATSAIESQLDVEAAKQCPVPMLIVYGREDKVGPPENALACAEAFPNADLVVFGHCGHWVMIERADDFNALMMRFLQGQDRRMTSPPVRSQDLLSGSLSHAAT
ncbi:MAG: alpha/beta fold hydrolase [Xanthobacteraceae bacterium]